MRALLPLPPRRARPLPRRHPLRRVRHRGRPRAAARPPDRAVRRRGLALSVSLLVVVAAFASLFANRIQERNTFVVAPFFLIALLVWVDRGAPRPLVLSVAAAVGAALLPLAIPFERFVETGAISDTLALLPIWDAYGSLLFDSIDATVLIGGAIAAAAPPARPTQVRARAPAGHARLLPRDDAEHLVGRAGVQAGVGRCALPGHSNRRPQLDRRGGTGRCARRGRLDGTDGSVRRQPERVLQPQGRADLLHRRRPLPAGSPRRSCASTSGTAPSGSSTTGAWTRSTSLLESTISPDRGRWWRRTSRSA